MDDGAGRVALLCVRDSRRFGLQVLLRAAVTAGDAASDHGWFPEGNVEPDDFSPRVLERCRGLTGTEASRLLGRAMKPARALGHWVAGMRVLIGTAGVFFTVESTPHTRVRQTSPAFGNQAPDPGALELAADLATQDLHLDLARLLFFSSWAGVRAGTWKRFFLVRAPEGVRVAGFVWRRPDRALLLWRKQDLPLDFATFSSLRTLSDFSSCEALVSEYSSD